MANDQKDWLANLSTEMSFLLKVLLGDKASSSIVVAQSRAHCFSAQV